MPAAAWAQGSVLQGGARTTGHVPAYSSTGQGGTQATVIDGGGAAGGGPGVGVSELGITARGTGTAPFVGQGTGPLGTIFCTQDASTTNSTGYHYLCLSPNAQGGGLITYGAGGAASALPLSFIVNGVRQVLPTTSTPTAAVTGGSATGTLLTLGATQNGGAVYTGTGSFTGISVTWGAALATAPTCTVAPLLSADLPVTSSASTTALSITTTSQSHWFYYSCS